MIPDLSKQVWDDAEGNLLENSFLPEAISFELWKGHFEIHKVWMGDNIASRDESQMNSGAQKTEHKRGGEVKQE